MNIPKLEKREYSDIPAEIKSLSEAFTPEWNFDPDDPDMGAALAMIAARMFGETIAKFNKTPEKNLIEFFNKTGAEQLCAKPASGYLRFEVSGSENNVGGEFIDRGSAFNVSNEDGENVVFTMSEPLYAVNSRITAVISTDSESDSIHKLYSYDEEDERCSFGLGAASDGNLQRHALYLRSESYSVTAERMKLRLRFILDHADDISLNTFYDTVLRCGIFYSSEDGFTPCVKLIRKSDEFQFEFDSAHKPLETEIMGELGQWFMIPFTDSVAVNDASRIYIEKAALGSFVGGIAPDGVFDDMTELNPTALFPFGRTPLPYSSVYFSCSGVLGRKGSIVTFEFKNHYNRIPINDADEVENIDWKFVMKKTSFSKPKSYDVFIKNVVWEYFGGSGWVRLFDDDRYGGVFDGTNDGSTVRITFQCPNDISEVILPSGAAYAIRARVETVENFLKTTGDYIMPQIFLPIFSYKYDALPELSAAAVENSLELRYHRFSEGSLRAASTLPEDGKCLNFAFSSKPDKGNIHILFVSGNSGNLQAEPDKKYAWEYLTAKGWRALGCVDETKGLSETGLLTLNGNGGFCETKMFGVVGYWLRLRCSDAASFPVRGHYELFMNCARARNIVPCGEEYFNADDENGYDCNLTKSGICTADVWVDELPIISRGEADRMIKDGEASPKYDENGDLSQLWVKWKERSGDIAAADRTYVLDRDSSRVIFDNSKPPKKTVGENVMISYTVCSGSGGNIAAASEFAADSNRGLISRIYNPMKMSGGEGKESVSSEIARCAAQLRLRSRVCTAADIEAAIKAADRSVLKVKAFGGRNAKGDHEPGAVTAAVLFKDPETFSEKRAALQKTLAEMCGAVIRGGKISVVKPIAVKCAISASIAVRGSDLISRVRLEINAKLREYFDLEKGNIDKKGWAIGELPDKPMIYGLISSIPEVIRIDKFELLTLTDDGDEINRADLDKLKKQGMTIAELARSEITISC